MKFSLFENVKSQKGIWCTLEQWMKYSASKRVKQICDAISQLSPDDHEAIGELKKGLPIVTWQAYFEGRRLNEQAETMFLRLIDKMAACEGVTEQLKAQNQLLWVQRMNNIQDRAIEVVNNDLIYT